MTFDVSPRVEIAILAKAPIPGLAKTRLIPLLGRDGAAVLQRWLLQRAVATAVIADAGSVSLWCAPDVGHPDFLHCRAFGQICLRTQPEGDLGSRMRAAVAEFGGGAGTLVIGTDCPALTPGLIRHGAAALREHEAVVIPAEDGGYALIGLRRPEPRLFEDIDWSTERVMDQTRVRLRETGLRWHEMAPLWDVDRAEDFERLVAWIPQVRAVVMGRQAA